MSSKRKQAETKYNHYEEYKSSSKKVYMAFYEDKTQYKQTGSLFSLVWLKVQEFSGIFVKGKEGETEDASAFLLLFFF